MAKVRLRHDKTQQLVQHPNHRGRTLVTAESVYDDTDPIVVAYPDLFEYVGDPVAGRKRTTRKKVEKATAAPGETR